MRNGVNTVRQSASAEAAVSFRDILGIRVFAGTSDEAIRLVDERRTGAGPLAVAFLNAHSSNIAGHGSAMRFALSKCLVLNDGIGVDIAARFLTGHAFPENLNGTDFTPRFLQATRHEFRIFLLGARPGVAERAGDMLVTRSGRHTIVGTHHGYFSEADVPRILDLIRNSGADLLLVGLGNPAQEIFVARYADKTGCALVFAVGALFDFESGRVRRASPPWRQLGLEWLHRLILEPRRLWRRYLIGNTTFLMRILRERFRRHTEVT